MSNVPDYFYTQSAVIPFRYGQNDVLEVLLITSRKKKRWVIPKGVKEPELSPEDSASKEAFEEAGIEGQVLAGSIGFYQYEKWGGTCSVSVYVMKVAHVLETWPESHRDREWLSVEEAAARMKEQEMQIIMRQLPGFLERKS
ncbi:NUDIX hydrolase [Magnetococcales bacterium HHB-1]